MFDSKKFIERQLSNNGGPPTKLLTMDDSLEFMMVLPGDTAKKYRKDFCVIIKRYFAGDQSLHTEIDGNAASCHPIAQMARESLGMQAHDSQSLVGLKRRREELELLKFEEEIKGMAQARIKSEEETKGMAQARILGLKAELEQLSDSSTTKLDEPTRLMFKDTLQSLLVSNSKPAPAKSQKQLEIEPKIPEDILKQFLCTLANANSLATKLTGRDFHKKYMEYHHSTGGSLDTMLNETLFCRAMKDFTGVTKKRGKQSMVYTLDHALIKRSVSHMGPNF